MGMQLTEDADGLINGDTVLHGGHIAAIDKCTTANENLGAFPVQWFVRNPCINQGILGNF